MTRPALSPQVVVRCIALVALAIPAIACERASAQEGAPAKASTAAVRAAESLQARVDGLRVETNDRKTENLQFRKQPLLKYSDAAREYLAAGVWRLGESGRPAAFLTLQYAQRDEWRLDYELLSFSEVPFQVTAPRALLAGDGTPPKFTLVPGAEKLAASEKQRLIQLRTLARRFTASEKFRDDSIPLRLLPQPIDRYADSDHDVVDAGIFVFAYGTNPEAVLMLEGRDDGWQFAVGRLAWAELIVELDGKEVARFDQLSVNPAAGAYRTDGHAIEPLQP